MNNGSILMVMMKNSKSKMKGPRGLIGFTLAEVLITLGIVGIVAAMTIPTLISNISAGRNMTQYKKAVSTLSQAALMSRANFELDYGSAISISPDEDCASAKPEEVLSFCSLLNGSLSAKTYRGSLANFQGYSINVVQPATNTNDSNNDEEGSEGNDSSDQSVIRFNTNTSDYLAYSLADGSLVAFPKDAFACSVLRATLMNKEWIAANTRCIGFIDVNGKSLPNKIVNCDGVDSTIIDNSTSCNVKHDPLHTADIYPIIFHDAIVEPATPAAKYLLGIRKSTLSSDKPSGKPLD